MFSRGLFTRIVKSRDCVCAKELTTFHFVVCKYFTIWTREELTTESKMNDRSIRDSVIFALQEENQSMSAINEVTIIAPDYY